VWEQKLLKPYLPTVPTTANLTATVIIRKTNKNSTKNRCEQELEQA